MNDWNFCWYEACILIYHFLCSSYSPTCNGLSIPNLPQTLKTYPHSRLFLAILTSGFIVFNRPFKLLKEFLSSPSHTLFLNKSECISPSHTCHKQHLDRQEVGLSQSFHRRLSETSPLPN
jgi:hypothetical protein